MRLEAIFFTFSENYVRIRDYESISLYDDLPIRFVFIDGDHSFHGVKTDSEAALTWIEKQGGIIVWHDYYSTSPDWCGVYRYLNEEVALRYNLKVIESTWLAYVEVNYSGRH